MTTRPKSELAQTTAKVGVIIPVYGEASPVCSVLHHFKPGLVRTICLIVDVPLRKDMERIREAARYTGITVHIIKNRYRTGVGSSLRQGFRFLSETGDEVAVIMAGNGKDDPGEIIRLIKPVLEGECDYVQGSRYLPGGKRSGMPLTRVVFNRLYPMIWTILTQKRCTDVTNGFRCYRLEIIRDHRMSLDQHWLDGYSLEYYLHYKALTLGYKVREVPVSKTYSSSRKGGYSKIQPLRDWWPIVSPLALLFLGVRK